MFHPNRALALADAFEQADRITSVVAALPNDDEQLQPLLDVAHQEACQIREGLEVELDKVANPRQWLLQLQRELIATLRRYKFAAAASASLHRRNAAMKAHDHEQFKQGVRDFIHAAQEYLSH